MNIPEHAQKPSIDFMPFMEELDEKYGWDHRDMAAMFKDGYKKDVPYQDVWHWLLDNPFSEFNRGGNNYLDIKYYLGLASTPDYVKKVLKAIDDEVPQDHPARDGDSIVFYVDW